MIEPTEKNGDPGAIRTRDFQLRRLIRKSRKPPFYLENRYSVGPVKSALPCFSCPPAPAAWWRAAR